MKLACLAAAAMLIAPSLAMAECAKPTPPAAIDGATATMEQLMAAKTSASAFIAASDTYQQCVLDDLKAQQVAAKAAKTKLSPDAKKAASAATAANQKDKEKVGADFNAAVAAYKASHPS